MNKAGRRSVTVMMMKVFNVTIVRAGVMVSVKILYLNLFRELQKDNIMLVSFCITVMVL